MAAMSQDRRISAAVNIDGTPYGSLPSQHLDRPVMLLQSDPAMGKSGERFREGNRRILENLVGAAGYRYTLRRTNHYSFSDFPLFFSPPGRWLASLGLACMHCIPPEQTYRATGELVRAFLYGSGMLERVAARYPSVVGGRVAKSRLSYR